MFFKNFDDGVLSKCLRIVAIRRYPAPQANLVVGGVARLAKRLEGEK